MITLVAIWVAWCALHSLLISRFVRNKAKMILGPYFSLYRLLYVGFSILSLIPVLMYQFSLPTNLLVPGNSGIWTVQVILILYAAFMFYAGVRVYDMGYFLGVRQWRDFHLQKTVERMPFQTEGILSHVRHPWYSGGIAFLWGVGPCTDVYLVSRIVLTIYLIVGTLLEEKRLQGELGRQYLEYSREVPMLIPWKHSPLSMFADTWKKS